MLVEEKEVKSSVLHFSIYKSPISRWECCISAICWLHALINQVKFYKTLNLLLQGCIWLTATKRSKIWAWMSMCNFYSATNDAKMTETRSIYIPSSSWWKTLLARSCIWNYIRLIKQNGRLQSILTCFNVFCSLNIELWTFGPLLWTLSFG